MEYRTFIGISPFHPSPSLGPLRTELYIYSFIRKYGGSVYIKCDDTNPDGQSSEYFKSYIKVLEDCGCAFRDSEIKYYDGDMMYQSDCSDIYDGYLGQLVNGGFTSEKNGLISLDVQKLANALGIREVVVVDMLKGNFRFNMSKSGYSYIPLYSVDNRRFFFHLTTVVDEYAMGVNLIMRGEDKISVTPIHELIRIFFSMTPPVYVHLPLLMNQNDGKRLRGTEFYIHNLTKKYALSAIVEYALKSGYLYKKGDMLSTLESFIDVFDYKRIKKKSGSFVPLDFERIVHASMHAPL